MVSEHSRRRTLEMAVIDAAIALDTRTSNMGYRLSKEEQAMHEAVLRYCLYGLAEPRFTGTCIRHRRRATRPGSG